MPEFTGKIVCNNPITLRFSDSGKLRLINCIPSQIVRKGETLAALDPKPVQISIDIELADYRRIRSEFDQLSRQIPNAKTEDEKTKKEIAQSKLDISVKNVEKYKLTIDNFTLIAPCDSVVENTEGLYPGVNVTPSSNPIKLIPLDSNVFEIESAEEEFYKLVPNQTGRILLKNGKSFDSEIIYLSPSTNSKGLFSAHLRLPNLDLSNYRIGSTGKVLF